VNKYQIQSVLISPDAWLFDATTATKISENLSFTSPQEHHNNRHVVTFECEAENIDAAWRSFYKEVLDFVEAAAFITTSYLAFFDWNHVIINKTQNVAWVSHFERTLGTSMGLYSQDEVDSLTKIIDEARKDVRLKNFLHCYRMAIMVDVPETQDAYEKYLILACEALAGEIDNGSGSKKYDATRLKTIVGKELHKYFFSSVDPLSGKTIRNANMHNGKSPNQKPGETLKLVNKLRGFIASEYGITHLPMIKEENSPTRGLYRDDGGVILVQGDAVDKIALKDITTLEKYMSDVLKMGLTIVNAGTDEGRELLKHM
jgi:hypothetical protein